MDRPEAGREKRATATQCNDERHARPPSHPPSPPSSPSHATAISRRIPRKGEAALFKQARSREEDISIVTFGMRFKLSSYDVRYWLVEEIAIAFGGMAPKTVMAAKTMERPNCGRFDEATFLEARGVLRDEFRMVDDVPGCHAEYRLALACGFLHKFYLHCVGELRKYVAEGTNVGLPPVAIMGSEEECAADTGWVSAPKPSIPEALSYPELMVVVGLDATHETTKGALPLAAKAAAAEKSNGDKTDLVGRPAIHSSGPLQCKGEALYANDIPVPPNALHGSLILASRCQRSTCLAWRGRPCTRSS